VAEHKSSRARKSQQPATAAASFVISFATDSGQRTVLGPSSDHSAIAHEMAQAADSTTAAFKNRKNRKGKSAMDRQNAQHHPIADGAREAVQPHANATVVQDPRHAASAVATMRQSLVDKGAAQPAGGGSDSRRTLKKQDDGQEAKKQLQAAAIGTPQAAETPGETLSPATDERVEGYAKKRTRNRKKQQTQASQIVEPSKPIVALEHV
jgi:hypothetical protein